jgi:hypothetical protein
VNKQYTEGDLIQVYIENQKSQEVKADEVVQFLEKNGIYTFEIDDMGANKWKAKIIASLSIKNDDSQTPQTLTFEGIGEIKKKPNKEDLEYLPALQVDKNKISYKFLGFVIILILIFFILGTMVYTKHRKRKVIISKRNNWLARLDAADNLASLAQIWRERDDLKLMFSSKETEITDFFNSLNEIQFKPAVDQSDEKRIINLKDHLKNELKNASHRI